MNYQKIIQKIPKEALEKENLTEAEVLYYAENVKYTDDKLFRDVFASNTEVSNNLLKYFIGLLLEVEVVSVVINNSVFVTQRKNQKGACFELRPSIFLNMHFLLLDILDVLRSIYFFLQESFDLMTFQYRFFYSF